MKKTRKSKRYLTPAGREWLRARCRTSPPAHVTVADQTELREWAEIAMDLWNYEFAWDAWGRRPRGRPTTGIYPQRPEDEDALSEYNTRIYEHFLGRRPVNPDKLLRDIAREIDERESWCGDPDTRYKRLKRLLAKREEAEEHRLEEFAADARREEREEREDLGELSFYDDE